MTRDDFAGLHDPTAPLVLYNVWDAGSAMAVAEAGARALATGSLSVAGAQGYEDGEELPFECLLRTTAQIARRVDLPLTVDVETGYGDTAADVEDNARAVREAGAVGCNLEDRIIATSALRDTAEQCERIAAARAAGLFVNARTDLFLGPLMAGEDPNRTELVDPAIDRAAAYRDAGADGFFVPGLSDPALLERLCKAVALPVNTMQLDGMGSAAELGRLGVARISYGPAPWRAAMAGVTRTAEELYAAA